MRRLVLLLLLAGCETARGPFEDIEAPFGGFDFSSEQPQFGLRADFVAAGESAEPQALIAAPPVTERSVAVWAAWGHLVGDRSEEEWLQWNGTLQASHGSLELLRTIAFDRHDRVLPPPDARTVAFESRTRPHFDGLVARLDSTSDAELTLSTPRITHRVTPSFAPALDQVDVPASTTRLSVLTVPLIPSQPCAHAVVTGRWRAPAERRGIQARLLGRWLTPEGALVGHWRGFLGQRKDGSRVAFAKLIDGNGNALALLRGTFDDNAITLELVSQDDTTLGGVELAVPSTVAERKPLIGVAQQDACF